jgi:small-conductance mechanosensitive channel
MPQNREPRWRWTIRRDGTGLPAPREALQALEAKIRPDFKRAVAGGILAFVLLAVSVDMGGVHRHGRLRFVAIGAGIAFALVGLVAVRSAARETGRIAHVRASGTAGAGLYVLVSVIGYILVLLGVLQVLDVHLGSLLVGGAVTGVVLGIAAQQSLGNFFAGLVLLFSRPFVPGDRIKIHSGALGGPFEGVITGSGLVYTTILTAEGSINLPNSGLLGSAIGPAPEAETSA